MFTSHRYAAANGAADVAGLLDESWIAEALSADLAKYIPAGFEAYVSVHPWSSMICADALSELSIPGSLVDYHSDFGAFPVVTHQRIQAYCGGGRIRALRPAFRARCHAIGVAVPRRFHCERQVASREAMLVVSAGADGWAVNAMRAATTRLIGLLAPERIALLAPTEGARASWIACGFGDADVVTNCSDISAYLAKARWYLSKGGGTAVAEGLAAGCLGFVGPSGIFWEDEAAEHLFARGIVADVQAPNPRAQFRDANVSEARAQCRNAADALWALVEAGLPPRRNQCEETILSNLVTRVAEPGEYPLPNVTSALRTNLERWLAEWRGVE